MRTEHQLRTALRFAAGKAPNPDEVLQRILLRNGPPSASPSTASRGRRGLEVLTGVAAAGIGIAVLVTAVVLLPDLRPRPVPQGAGRGALGDWTIAAQLKPPGGWTLGSREISGTHEVTTIGDATGKGFCRIEVNRAGSGQHTKTPAANEPVRIHDRAGSYAAPSQISGGQASVFWSYAADAWASVACQLGPGGLGSATTPAAIRDLVVQLAEAVVFAAQPLLVPIRLTRLPNGYSVQSAIQDLDNPEGWQITLAPDQASPSSPTINIVSGSGKDDSAPNTTIGSYPATLVTYRVGGGISSSPRPEVSYTALILRTTPVPVSISVTNTAADKPSSRHPLLRQIATDITYAASPTNAETWFNAATALQP